MVETEADAGVAPVLPVRKPPAFVLRVSLGMVTGLLLAASFPPIRFFLLLPAAVACLLLLLEGMTVRQAGYIGLACGVVFFGCALCWLWGMFGAAALTLWVIAGLSPALFSVLWVRLRARLPQIPAWLLAGVVWTGVDVFRSEWLWPRFSWMGLGYTVVDAPLLVTPAAWIGCYGLTFGIVALSALLAAPFHAANKTSPNPSFVRREAAFLFAGWLALAAVPLPSPYPVRPLHARLVQADSEDDEDLFRLSHSPSGTHADVIVWPEYSFMSDPLRPNGPLIHRLRHPAEHDQQAGNVIRFPNLWTRLAGLAQTERSSLLFGAKQILDPHDDRAFRNTAYLLDPSGRLIGKHVKIHTVPLINDGLPGNRADVFATAFGRVGVATCFDMDFPDVARRLVDGGAEAFLVPSDNPREWGRLQHIQHVQLFQMRAVECGRWLATTDVAGNTFVVAPTGRVTQRVPTQEPTVLEARVGRLHGRTLFVRGGWLFGPTCLIATVLLFAWSLLPGRRGTKASSLELRAGA